MGRRCVCKRLNIKNIGKRFSGKSKKVEYIIWRRKCMKIELSSLILVINIELHWIDRNPELEFTPLLEIGNQQNFQQGRNEIKF